METLEFEDLMQRLNKIRIKMEEFIWSETPEHLKNKYHIALNAITDLLQTNGNVIKIIQPSADDE